MISKIEKIIQLLNTYEVISATIPDVFAKFSAYWDECTLTERRQILEIVCEKYELRRKKVTTGNQLFRDVLEHRIRCAPIDTVVTRNRWQRQ